MRPLAYKDSRLASTQKTLIKQTYLKTRAKSNVRQEVIKAQGITSEFTISLLRLTSSAAQARGQSRKNVQRSESYPLLHNENSDGQPSRNDGFATIGIFCRCFSGGPLMTAVTTLEKPFEFAL
jgi:hypothetical protein